MITLYHTPISLNSRRVWIALLEKGLPFELVEVNLMGGEQFQPEFLAMNPYHHIPVLVDGETTVIESFAILDYLEAKYPEPALMPRDAAAIATVRMVQMATHNELMNALGPLTRQFMGFGQVAPEEVEKAKQQAAVSLRFFESKLADQPFFGGDHLSQADIILGIVTSWFGDMNISLAEFPRLQRWMEQLQQRPAWQKTQPTADAIADFKERARTMMAKRQGAPTAE